MLSVTIKADKAMQYLLDAGARLRHPEPAYRKIAVRLEQDILRNFREGGWFPEPWADTRRGGQTLVHHSTLRGSIHGSASSGADFASAGSDVFYGLVHQVGAGPGLGLPAIRAKAGKYLKFEIGDQWIQKEEVTIPRRPWLPVDDAGNLHSSTQQFVADTLLEHILREAAA